LSSFPYWNQDLIGLEKKSKRMTLKKGKEKVMLRILGKGRKQRLMQD